MSGGLRSLLVRHCAPTLLGLKSAGLIRCRAEDRLSFLRECEAVRRELLPRGVELRVLKECPRSQSFLVYVFRKGLLFAELESPEAQGFLRDCGYAPSCGGDALLKELGRRLCLREEFPHEIGLFLGYPVEDVAGFIRNGGQGYTLMGHWKVYGDARAAQERFSRYDRCTRECCVKYENGVPLTELIGAA